MLDCYGRFTFLVRFVALVTLPCVAAYAQGITVDGRLSPAQTLAGPNYAIGPGLGRQVGGNLFHSFGIFGLNQGETATFSGPPSVGNVIGRVTGGAASSINGGIKSGIPGANVYLINPAGVVFGPNASVNVGGSFHAGSADYLRLKDGARFQATNPDVSTLSAAPPEAFGFLSTNPQPVTVSGSDLRLAPNQTLGLVGGPVTISGGTLRVPGGRVHIESAAGPGEEPVDPRAGPAPTVTRSGAVQVVNKANINVNDTSTNADSGSVYIRAGDLSIAASTIAADNSGPGPAGVLSLHGDRVVTISNGATVGTAAAGTGRGPDISIGTATEGTVTLDSAKVNATATAAGDGGAVAISTGSLMLQNGAVVLSRTAGSGNGGPITVAADSVLIDGSGTGVITQTSGAGLVTASGVTVPPGASGSIVLTGGTLTIQNAASINSYSSGNGAGGSISLAFTGETSINTGGQVYTRTSGSSTGTAGDLTITTKSALTLSGGSLIEASTTTDSNAPAVTVTAGELTVASGSSILGESFSKGRGSEISINVTGDVSVYGHGFSSRAGGISASSIAGSSVGSGNAGNVNISAGTLTLSQGGIIRTAANASGNAGDIGLNVEGALVVDGTEEGGFATGVSSQATARSSGSAGTVRVNAGSVSVLGGGFVSSSTSGEGAAGSVLLSTPGALLLDSRGQAGFPPEISGSADGAQSGDAGMVTVGAGSISLLNGGVIISNTQGLGTGGSVLVTTPGALLLDGRGQGGNQSGISASTIGPQSGNAGTVTVRAGSVSVLDGGVINSSTLGKAAGGSVVVATPGALLLDGQGDAGTRIAASALGPQSGDAGAVTVSAGNVTVQGGAQIASSTSGSGQGGDVNVTASSNIRLVGPGPQITATASSTGNAGSITVSAPQVNLQGGASISTAAQAANGGNIKIGPGDLLYLQSSSITTSVNSAFGNGGNITVDPRFVVLDSSVIEANAVGGDGGNVLIQADAFVPSADSAVTATSQRGISGEIFIIGPLLDLSSTLVVLASELRSTAALLREGCAARGASPRSSLVVAGRGGQRQGLEATLPALYFVHRPISRPVSASEHRAQEALVPEASAVAVRTSIGLSARCG